MRTFANLLLTLLLAAGPAAAGCGNRDVDALSVETLTTAQGKVSVLAEKYADGSDGLRNVIGFNGKPVFTAEDYSYLDLCGVWKTPDGSAVLFAANEGGSASPPDHLFFLLLRAGRKPEVVTSDEFHSPTRSVKIMADATRVMLDLGYEKQRPKSAVLSGGKLTVSLGKQLASAPLAADDCDWLYELVADECTKEALECASFDDDEYTAFSVGAMTGMNTLRHRAGFRKSAFRKACVDHCSTGKAMPQAQFRSSVCGIGAAKPK